MATKSIRFSKILLITCTILFVWGIVLPQLAESRINDGVSDSWPVCTHTEEWLRDLGFAPRLGLIERQLDERIKGMPLWTLVMSPTDVMHDLGYALITLPEGTEEMQLGD